MNSRNFRAFTSILLCFSAVFAGSNALNFPKIIDRIDDTNLLNRLAESIKFQTISWQVHQYNVTELVRFRDFIIKTFPLVHSSNFISYEIVNNYSLLYTIRGKNEALQPYMLTAHMDVVPVDESGWSVPAFEGTIKDNVLYGRGALDNKGNLMGILEALEHMLRKAIQPERGFYIGFGHDEEVSGADGAGHIAKLLTERGVKLLYLLDEGLFVTTGGALPGVDKPIGLIGVTEKGYLTVKLSVNAKPGHSSIPSSEMAIGILAKALSNFGSDSHPNMFGNGPEIEMLREAASHAKEPYNTIYADVNEHSSYLARLLEQSPFTNAMIRTTTALTVIRGGIKENVLPSTAYALINHRVHPVQSLSEAIDFDKSLVNDSRVVIEATRADLAHPIAPYNESSFGYQVIKNTISQLVPNLVVVPACLTGNTDTRWYLNLTDSLYRFSAFDIDIRKPGIIHGNDERIPLETYQRMVNFYYRLITNSNSAI